MFKRIFLAVFAIAISIGVAIGQSAPQSSIARPNNTTTYGANTGWNNTAGTGYFTFAGACSFPGIDVIVSGVDVYSSANPTLKLTGYLFLFSTPPVTPIADGATFTIAAATGNPPTGDYSNITGTFSGISIGLGNNQASGAANSGVSISGLTSISRCISTSLYGMFEVTNAYVPASGEVLTVIVHTLKQN